MQVHEISKEESDVSLVEVTHLVWIMPVNTEGTDC